MEGLLSLEPAAPKFVELAVWRAPGHEVAMPAWLRDPTVLQTQDKVCLGHCLEVMSYQEAGLPCHESLQSLPDRHFALNIKASHWLVQDQNGGISDEGPGDGDPLPLATR